MGDLSSGSDTAGASVRHIMLMAICCLVYRAVYAAMRRQNALTLMSEIVEESNFSGTL